ncbi:hypothetical protein ES703_100683 [subsurface metagenome]
MRAVATDAAASALQVTVGDGETRKYAIGTFSTREGDSRAVVVAIDNCIGHNVGVVRIGALENDIVAIRTYVFVIGAFQNDDNLCINSNINGLLNRVEWVLAAAVLTWITDSRIIWPGIRRSVIVYIPYTNTKQQFQQISMAQVIINIHAATFKCFNFYSVDFHGYQMPGHVCRLHFQRTGNCLIARKYIEFKCL